MPPVSLGEASASALSRLLFLWTEDVVSLGRRRALHEDDLWPVGPLDGAAWHASHTAEKVDAFTNVSAATCKLSRALWSAYGEPFVNAGWLKLLDISLELALPMLLQRFLLNIEDDHDVVAGLCLALAMFVVGQAQVVNEQLYVFRLSRLRLHVNTGLASVVYGKTLRITNGAVHRLGMGRVLTIQNTDVPRIAAVVFNLHGAWSLPVTIACTLGYLIFVLGALPAFAGVLAIVAGSAVSKRLIEVLQKRRHEVLAKTEARIKLCAEAMGAMRTIKIMNWELEMLRRLREARAGELGKLRETIGLNIALSFVFTINPLLVAISAFASFALAGTQELTPSRAFTAVYLFNALRGPLMVFAPKIGELISTIVSLDRTSAFLVEEEVPNRKGVDQALAQEHGAQVDFCIVGCFRWSSPANTVKEQPLDLPVKPSFSDRARMLFQKVRRSGDGGGAFARLAVADESEPDVAGSQDQFTLRVSTRLGLQRGTLTVVIGEVGSGKTMLLSALLGELSGSGSDGGRVHSAGRIAYSAQDPWIQNATIRDNVICGQDFDKERYDRVLDACCLGVDLAALPAGEHTEIGERGINLSGGQKHRVALARACYLDGDLVLLDDPLSAVDAHVGRHIFEHCICGILAKKTRILVTHQLQYASSADSIVVMRAGKVFMQGSYDEVCGLEEIRSWNNDNRRGEDGALPSGGDRSGGDEIYTEGAKESRDAGRLVQDEERETGAVAKALYMRYLRAFGPYIPPALVLLYGSGHSFQLAKDYWLAVWSSSSDRRSAAASYIGVYAGIALAFSMCRCAQQVTLLYFGALRAARKLHDQLLTTVFHLPMSFFDTQPMGRLINRFTKDTGTIDTGLANPLGQCLMCVTLVFFEIVILAFVAPSALIALIPVAYWYSLVQKSYLACSREITRLSSLANSPIFSHCTETVVGLSSIRAFAFESSFHGEMLARLERANRVNFASAGLKAWLSLRITTMGYLIALAASLGICIFHRQLSAGLAGFVMTIAYDATLLLDLLVRQSSQIENSMNAVERVTAFDMLEPEAAWIVPDRRPKRGWPARGALCIERLCVQYRPELPLVLRDVSFEVAGGENVGICGRTGCGKSTLVLVLFRLLEAKSGSICIDGIDVATIGLHDLRKRALSLVPQDPVLFHGSIRANLDPFGEHASHELLEALDEVGMKERLVSLGGLDFALEEHGSNLSTGQRQLLCLCRALLRRTKLIILDEATSNLDHGMDEVIQRTIRTRLATATTLTIAHRLGTIVDAGRILLLEKGTVAEYGAPADLLASGGAFAGLYRAAMAANLRE